MNHRIETLRRQSMDAVPSISVERSLLLTEWHHRAEAAKASVPIQRAMAFAYILANKHIYIGDGELIVGERGPAPKATPTYPEICVHSVEDLRILHSRPKTSYAVSEEAIQSHQDKVLPFWKGKSIRERIFEEMTDEWIAAYEAGMFTEFQEQRTPGHTVLGGKIYHKGFADFKQEIQEGLQSLDYYNDPDAFDKQEELQAMMIAADALIHFAQRHASALHELSAREADAERKTELSHMAALCERVPEHQPRTFWEALQYYWFVHLGVITELNPWDSFNPGRLDQHLYPFYTQDLGRGILTEERARELLQAFWIKFNNHPAPPKVGVTAEESGTYTDFALINLGGLKEDGSDGVNAVTYLLLDVIEEMRLLQPSSMVQLSKKNPDRYIKRALTIVKTGFGQPSIFNSDAIVQELVRQGKSIEDARCGGASGCVESGAFGKEAYILTGYFNLPKLIELVFTNGWDPYTKKQIGLQTGAIETFRSFDEFFAAFEKQLRYFIDIKIRGNNVIERIYAKYMPVPFLSLLIDDCIANGKDYHSGGARYNTSYIQGVGLGSITDCLASIRYHVYDKGTLSLEELAEALQCNFAGFEALRNRFLQDTPKYGNDDDYADELTRKVFEAYYSAIDGRPNTRGGHHRINLLPTTVHVYFGKVTGALPDGRYATEPLSEGISPVQGADRNGPTSVIKSAAKIDHLRTGGTLLNQKFTPQIMNDDSGITKVAQLVRTYFRMDGHHIQFNVVTADQLRKAQQCPEQHRDLIVRVAGYSDYFVDLGEELQNEIIHRTEHAEV
jgi:trans-4-hydroxy-L-proline dehydratase